MALEDRKKCFVVGPIGASGTETRKNADFLLKGIIRFSIQEALNLEIWRADEDSKPGMITDKLINDINDADLVIADLSELNANAFYELGIRHAAAKPSIHVASAGTKLPFDNMGHRVIFYEKSDWASIEEARTQLFEQAKTALGAGFEVSNPVTQALTSKVMRASASDADKVLIDLQNRITFLESEKSEKSPTTEDYMNDKKIAHIIQFALNFDERLSESKIDAFVYKIKNDSVFSNRVENYARLNKNSEIAKLIDSMTYDF